MDVGAPTPPRRPLRRLLITLEFLACMGVVTKQVSLRAVEMGPRALGDLPTVLSVAAITAALAAFAIDLLKGSPPTSAAVRSLIGLPLLIGCVGAYSVFLVLLPFGGLLYGSTWYSVILPATYALRRILWLGRDGSACPQPALDRSPSPG